MRKKTLRRESNDDTPKASNDEDSDQVVLRRSKRIRKAPDRLTYYNEPLRGKNDVTGNRIDIACRLD